MVAAPQIPLADLVDGRTWIAHSCGGSDLVPEHGGPARLLVPHLYLWKAAKWMARARVPRRLGLVRAISRRVPSGS
ncbi:molybdopterin-dependent oxidoreductase [Streptomyces chartreusis]|uniref:molybdopterin-dependent oxidoreductase n=1 Tax=Streptomyces chartreusis TaxID=1969 RepID=UPI002E192822